MVGDWSTGGTPLKEPPKKFMLTTCMSKSYNVYALAQTQPCEWVMKPDRDQEDIPRLSNKEGVVLELLVCNRQQEMYGLELMEKSGERLKRGTIYVTLSRMEEKGYVSSRQETEHPSRPGIPRRLYRLTGYGMRVYSAWSLVRDQLFGVAGHTI